MNNQSNAIHPFHLGMGRGPNPNQGGVIRLVRVAAKMLGSFTNALGPGSV